MSLSRGMLHQFLQRADLPVAAVQHQALVHHGVPGGLCAKLIRIVLDPGEGLEDALLEDREGLARHAHEIALEGEGLQAGGIIHQGELVREDLLCRPVLRVRKEKPRFIEPPLKPIQFMKLSRSPWPPGQRRCHICPAGAAGRCRAGSARAGKPGRCCRPAGSRSAFFWADCSACTSHFRLACDSTTVIWASEVLEILGVLRAGVDLGDGVGAAGENAGSLISSVSSPGTAWLKYARRSSLLMLARAAS